VRDVLVFAIFLISMVSGRTGAESPLFGWFPRDGGQKETECTFMGFSEGFISNAAVNEEGARAQQGYRKYEPVRCCVCLHDLKSGRCNDFGIENLSSLTRLQFVAFLVSGETNAIPVLELPSRYRSDFWRFGIIKVESRFSTRVFEDNLGSNREARFNRGYKFSSDGTYPSSRLLFHVRKLAAHSLVVINTCGPHLCELSVENKPLGYHCSDIHQGQPCNDLGSSCCASGSAISGAFMLFFGTAFLTIALNFTDRLGNPIWLTPIAFGLGLVGAAMIVQGTVLILIGEWLS